MVIQWTETKVGSIKIGNENWTSKIERKILGVIFDPNMCETYNVCILNFPANPICIGCSKDSYNILTRLPVCDKT